MTRLVLLEILVWLLNDVKSDYGTQFTGAISRELVNPYSFRSAKLRMSNTYFVCNWEYLNESH